MPDGTVRYRLASAFVGFGLATVGFISVVAWANGVIALLADPVGLLAVGCGVGAFGAVVWGLVVEVCGFGSFRARGAASGLLTGVFAPVVAVFSSILVTVVFGPAAQAGVFFAMVLLTPVGAVALPIVVAITVPYGIGTGLVIAEVLGREESDDR